jgi:hypothetical protein
MSQSRKRKSIPVVKNQDQALKYYFIVALSWRRGTGEFQVGQVLDFLREAQLLPGMKQSLVHRLQQLAMDIVFNNHDATAA